MILCQISRLKIYVSLQTLPNFFPRKLRHVYYQHILRVIKSHIKDNYKILPDEYEIFSRHFFRPWNKTESNGFFEFNHLVRILYVFKMCPSLDSNSKLEILRRCFRLKNGSLKALRESDFTSINTMNSYKMVFYTYQQKQFKLKNVKEQCWQKEV